MSGIPRTTDVLIIGAGIAGASCAYHLAKADPGLSITVVEKESLPGTGSTRYSTGGIRHQFSTELNIRLTKRSLDFFRRWPEEMGGDIGFRQHGYLFVTTSHETLDGLRVAAERQRSLGVPTEAFEGSAAGGEGRLRALFHGLFTEDLAGGSYCPLDGSADPSLALEGYLRQARRLGVRLVTSCEVTALVREGGRVTGAQTAAGPIHAGTVILTAGPIMAALASTAGVDLPIRPFRRQVFVFSTPPELVASDVPLLVDLDTGWYAHREKGGALLMGGTDRDTAPGTDQSVDWSALGAVAAAALHRVPSLVEAGLVRAYVGIRALTPDFHAIAGRPGGFSGLLVAGGFSGHGFMHSPAIGEIIAALALEQPVPFEIDLAHLSPDRFATHHVAEEKAIF